MKSVVWMSKVSVMTDNEPTNVGGCLIFLVSADYPAEVPDSRLKWNRYGTRLHWMRLPWYSKISVQRTLIRFRMFIKLKSHVSYVQLVTYHRRSLRWFAWITWHYMWYRYSSFPLQEISTIQPQEQILSSVDKSKYCPFSISEVASVRGESKDQTGNFLSSKESLWWWRKSKTVPIGWVSRSDRHEEIQSSISDRKWNRESRNWWHRSCKNFQLLLHGMVSVLCCIRNRNDT